MDQQIDNLLNIKYGPTITWKRGLTRSQLLLVGWPRAIVQKGGNEIAGLVRFKFI